MIDKKDVIIDKFNFDLMAFQNFVAPQIISKHRLYIIDEIGDMELSSDFFMDEMLTLMGN